MTDANDAPGVCFLFHGESKVGKTELSCTGPGHVLVIDAEGGTRFIKQKKIQWDGRSKPPEPSDAWKVCVVPVRDFDTLQSIYQWLFSGQHPFDTVVIDSISELQQRLVDKIAGVEQMKQQDWGELYRRLATLVRLFRDLTSNPTRPVKAVVLVAMTREVTGRKVPSVQGQLQTSLPYYIDVVGYFFMQTGEDGTPVRRLYLQPHPLFEAGDRTGLLGTYIDNPNLTTMLSMIHEGAIT